MILISPLLLKLQKQSSKRIFLLGDFNIDLLKYEISDLINNFIDTLSSNFNNTDEKYAHKACKSTFFKESFLNSQQLTENSLNEKDT